VPNRPGETLKARVTVDANGNQRFVVPVTLTVQGAPLPVDAVTVTSRPTHAEVHPTTSLDAVTLPPLSAPVVSPPPPPPLPPPPFPPPALEPAASASAPCASSFAGRRRPRPADTAAWLGNGAGHPTRAEGRESVGIAAATATAPAAVDVAVSARAGCRDPRAA